MNTVKPRIDPAAVFDPVIDSRNCFTCPCCGGEFGWWAIVRTHAGMLLIPQGEPGHCPYCGHKEKQE